MTRTEGIVQTLKRFRNGIQALNLDPETQKHVGVYVLGLQFHLARADLEQMLAALRLRFMLQGPLGLAILKACSDLDGALLAGSIDIRIPRLVDGKPREITEGFTNQEHMLLGNIARRLVAPHDADHLPFRRDPGPDSPKHKMCADWPSVMTQLGLGDFVPDFEFTFSNRQHIEGEWYATSKEDFRTYLMPNDGGENPDDEIPSGN